MKFKKIFLCVIVYTIIFKTIPAFATEIQSVEGRWMTGEYHTHTRQSNDATSVFMVLENLLKSAFREGIWDSMLGEGRRFWNFTNNDFHFKISVDNKYSSGYWPSEYSRNYTWVNGNTFKDVVNGMRSGNSFSVYGDIIDALDFSASSKGNMATMGSELSVIKNDMIDITIRFRSPEFNNYESISAHESEVNNKVEVDHIDLISGKVTAKLDEANYSKDTNETTKVITRFMKMTGEM